MQALSNNEDFLLKELSGDAQKRFLEYVDAWGIVNAEEVLESFKNGFSLGARFAYDAFANQEEFIKEK